MAVLSLSAVRDAYTIRASCMWSLKCTDIGLADVCCCYDYPSARGQRKQCIRLCCDWYSSVKFKFNLTNSHTIDELRFDGEFVWKVRVRVPSYRLMKRFTSGSSQLRLLKCAFTDVFGRGSDYGFLLCRSDGTIFFVFEERERARKKVNDSKYDERMSDLGVTAREWEHNI